MGERASRPGVASTRQERLVWKMAWTDDQKHAGALSVSTLSTLPSMKEDPHMVGEEDVCRVARAEQLMLETLKASCGGDSKRHRRPGIVGGIGRSSSSRPRLSTADT